MSNRHTARTIALQTLFELDTKEIFSLPKNEVEKIIIRNRDESDAEMKDISFISFLVNEVQDRIITIDNIITRAAPDWPMEKIGVVDRNILRMGLCELLFGDRKDVPPKVAIDEAIELAKTFGGDTSGKFVNGVLGAIYKEMGEPDKAQTTSKDKKVSTETMKIELLAGAVVYSHHKKELYIGLVHDVFGYWTLPKGRIEQGENEEQCAMREIKEEIGVTINIVEKLGENEYIANKPEVGKMLKKVIYYLAQADHIPLVLENKGGLDDVRWVLSAQIDSMKMYHDILPIIKKGIDLVPKNI